MNSRRTVPDHVTENIESIAQLQKVFGARVTSHQRAVDGATRGIGRPVTIYVLAGAVCLWPAYNAVAIARGWPVLDHPPFFWLQGTVTVYAAIVTTAVLSSQNRQNRENEQRAHLELQMSLLAEQKGAKIIGLLEELRRDLPNVRNRPDPEAEAMQERPDPRDVLLALESNMGAIPAADSGEPEDDTSNDPASR
jgi:uncharacterized membrane protein